MLNNLELYQLKECYEMAAYYTNDEIAKRVLREKAKSIEITTDYTPTRDDVVCHESEIQILSEVMCELALECDSDYSGAEYQYKDIIDNLPESGEKEYVLALLSLRKGTTESNRIEAIGHLTIAIDYAPNDLRLKTLARVLEEV